jgi:predicted porin
LQRRAGNVRFRKKNLRKDFLQGDGMKKSLVALAVGAAFVAPAAFADVTISGAINMGIEYLNVGDASGAAKATTNGAGLGNGGKSLSNFGISNNYSNVTISSVDDLGGGLKLDFAFQMQLANDVAGGTLSNRNSHIGLVSESWGGVWYGSNENIYERYLYTIDPLDGAAGLGGNLQMLGTPGGAAFQNQPSPGSIPTYTFYRRDSNTIWYDSPNFNGFTFGVAYGTNDDRASSQTNPQTWQVGVKYAGSGLPLQLWAAYVDRKDQFGLVGYAQNAFGVNHSSTGSTDTAAQLGGAYTLGDITLFAIYEHLQYKLDNTAQTILQKYKRDAYALGLKWNLATGYVGAQWIQALNGKCTLGAAAAGSSCSNVAGTGIDAEKTGATMIGVGYYHNLSKQTQAYVVGSWIDNKDFGTYGTAGISNGANFNAGSTIWGVGIGLKHSF